MALGGGAIRTKVFVQKYIRANQSCVPERCGVWIHLGPRNWLDRKFPKTLRVFNFFCGKQITHNSQEERHTPRASDRWHKIIIRAHVAFFASFYIVSRGFGYMGMMRCVCVAAASASGRSDILADICAMAGAPRARSGRRASVICCLYGDCWNGFRSKNGHNYSRIARAFICGQITHSRYKVWAPSQMNDRIIIFLRVDVNFWIGIKQVNTI